MKIKHGGTLVSLLFLLTVNFNAAATIYVDVRGGNSSGLPIAIVPFGVEGADKEIGESLSLMDQFILYCCPRRSNHADSPLGLADRAGQRRVSDYYRTQRAPQYKVCDQDKLQG